MSTSRKPFLASFADAYRWAVAGLVAYAVTQFDLPSISAILKYPVGGLWVVGYSLAILIGIILFAALIDYLLFHRLDPRDWY